MKARAFVLVAVAACGGTGQPPATHGGAQPTASGEPATPTAGETSCTRANGGSGPSFAVMRDERIGPLRIGMTADEVRTALGVPESIDGPIPDQVQGGVTWASRYPDRAVDLTLWAESTSQPPAISAMTVRAGSSLQTRFGIGVGSSGASVERAYEACWAPESTEGEGETKEQRASEEGEGRSYKEGNEPTSHDLCLHGVA